MRTRFILSLSLVAALLVTVPALITGCSGGSASGTNTGNTDSGDAQDDGTDPAGTDESSDGGTDESSDGSTDERLANSDMICPVTGEPASGDYTATYKGKVIAFASEDAMNRFFEDPDGYMALIGD